MAIYNETININTTKINQMINITEKIQSFIEKMNVLTGQVILFVPHTTAAITVNENTDPDVRKDMLYGLEKAFPIYKEYQHYEGNSHAHIKSSIIGVDQYVLIENGRLKLGQWQALYFCEFDGPRNRQCFMQLIGE